MSVASDPNGEGGITPATMTSGEYRDLLAKYQTLQSDVRRLGGVIGPPRSKARTALIVSGAVVGVAAISIAATKTWSWAFPSMPERRRGA